jgi:putative phosphoribosyl transferase
MNTRTQPFEDRQEAALCLAEILADVAPAQWEASACSTEDDERPHTVLVGLARGGVPVARTLATRLHLPFDLLVVRKLPVPGNPELAMGAMSEKGAEVLNEDVLRWIVDSERALSRACARESKEIERRIRLYRGGRKSHRMAGNHVVLVDDGAATGATMRAAIAAARKEGAARVTVALPVAPKETCDELATEADEVRCLWQPARFQSVGAYYRHFPQVSDTQVQEAIGVSPERTVPPQAASRPHQVQRALPI